MADSTNAAHWTAFHGARRIASGAPACVAKAVRKTLEAEPSAQIRIFSDETGRAVDLDPREAPVAVPLDAAQASTKGGVGRPKLGVSAREVTLLPRHWEWLAAQPGGASAALRKLVEAARKSPKAEADRARAAADRFMMAALGDAPGYESASRALYAGDSAAFIALSAVWPEDLRDHARRLAAPGFGGEFGGECGGETA